MEQMGSLESLIDYIGCGKFQVPLFLIAVVLYRTVAFYSVYVTVFLTYNPGWRCLDDNTTILLEHSNQSETADVTSLLPPSDNRTLDYALGSCESYDVCREIEFDPESSTILTEWGLLCDKAWLTRLITFVQFLGAFCGGVIGGPLSDLFGRKKSACVSTFLGGVFQLISSFSVTWQMFIITRFFIGALALNNFQIAIVYTAEMFSSKWRAIVMSAPNWQFMLMVACVYIYLSKQWREIEFFGVILHIITLIYLLWVPESLRWQGVQNRNDEFEATARRMARYNKKTLPDKINVSSIMTVTINEDSTLIGVGKTYTVMDIFRKGYRFKTLSLMFMYFTCNMLYFSLVYGVTVMHGDFFLNLFLIIAAEIPMVCIGAVAVKYLSRRLVGGLFYTIIVLCLLITGGTMFSHSKLLKEISSSILIPVAKATTEVTTLLVGVRIAELYPTVVRGKAVGWINSVAQIGSLIAPLIVPQSQEYLPFLMFFLGGVMFVSCVLSLILDETKGKPLRDDFE